MFVAGTDPTAVAGLECLFHSGGDIAALDSATIALSFQRRCVGLGFSIDSAFGRLHPGLAESACERLSKSPCIQRKYVIGRTLL